MGCGSSKSTEVVNVTIPSSLPASAGSSGHGQKDIHLSTENIDEDRGEMTDESSEGEERQPEKTDSSKHNQTGMSSDESAPEDNVQSSPRVVYGTEDTIGTYVTYLSTDKKAYRPGESLFIRAVMLDANTQRPPLKAAEVQRLTTSHPSVSIQQPSGLEVTWNVQLEEADHCGAWGVQINIPEEAECGAYLTKVNYASLAELYCAPAERQFEVRKARKQRTNVKLKFAKTKYLAGDKVHAALVIPPTDGSQRPVSVTATGTLEGNTMFTVKTTVTTGSRVPITFPLPSQLPSPCEFRLLCRVTADQFDASVIRSVPITQHVKLSAYPESGHIVVGLQCGLFFQAHTKSGDPIGVTVEVQELADNGDWSGPICTAESKDDHGGYLLLCPKRNRAYRLVTIQSGHFSGVCNLPKPRTRGVSLSTKKSVYEGGSPIWFRVGSSCRGSYCLRAFKLGNELLSVHLSFPQKETAFEYRHSLDNYNKSENYNDVLLSLPSYASGAIRVTVSDIRGLTVAERVVFVKCTRRLSIVADAVWSNSSSTKKKDLEINIKTLEGKSRIPVFSHLGVTVTKEESFMGEEINGPTLKLDKTNLFPEVNLSGLECLSLTDQMDDNYIGQSLLFEFAALQQPQSCIGTEAETVTASNQNQQSLELETIPPTYREKKSTLRHSLAQRLSSFQLLSGTTSQKQRSLNNTVKQLKTSSTPRIWSAIENLSYNQLKTVISKTQISDLQSIRWQGETLVHGVARSHYTNKKKEEVRTVLKLLLDEAGIDVDDQRGVWSDGNTALHLACERGNHIIVGVLLELGATHSLPNKWGMTPLSLAAGCGHTTVVELLLDQEQRNKGRACSSSNGVCIPTSLCKTGWSPLHYAASGGHVDVIHRMKMYADVFGSKLDCNIVTADELKLSPLHCSARYAPTSYLATQVTEYLLRNGANDIADARGYSYNQLAYLRESEKFGRLSRYSAMQQVNEVKDYLVDVDVNYKGLSKLIPNVASTATVATVVTNACQQFEISIPDSTNIPFFFIDKQNQCLVDQTVPCAVAVKVVSSDNLCLYHLDSALQICLNVTFYEYLSRLVAANNAEWEGPVLPDHGCVQLTSFLVGPGWSDDPKNLELCYTPAEYGLQEGSTVYFYSQLISEKKFPLRSTCLCDYGIQEQQPCKDKNSSSMERGTVQLQLCPLNITGTISIVVLKNPPNREPLKPPENTPALATESAQNQAKSTGKQQGKKPPPKEAPKKAPAKKGRGPHGKPLKLNLSSFETVKTVKDIILSQLRDHLQKEAGIEANVEKEALTCDLYVGDIFQLDILPLYASSLLPLPTPAVIKVYPRIIPNYSNLTNLFDFWMTPVPIDMNSESTDANSSDMEVAHQSSYTMQGESIGTDMSVSLHNQNLSAIQDKTEQPQTETSLVEAEENHTVSAVCPIKVHENTVETSSPSTELGRNVVNCNKDEMRETMKATIGCTTSSKSNSEVIQESGIQSGNCVVEADVHQPKSNEVPAEIKSTPECQGTTATQDDVPLPVNPMTENATMTASKDDVASIINPKTEDATTADTINNGNNGSLKPGEDDNLETSEHPTEKDILAERKRRHFLAWYDQWKTGMLWWGMKTLCGHTSFLRWVITDEATQIDRQKRLESAENELNCLAQDYCDSLNPILVQKDSGDAFEKKEDTDGPTTKKPVEIRLSEVEDKEDKVPKEPVVKAALGVLNWEAALGHKQESVMSDDAIIQPCLVWGDRKRHVKGSTEPFSDTVYWAADVKTDNSGNVQLKVSVDPNVSSYKLKVDAVSPSGALGRIECHLAVQNPLCINWIMPDFVCSGDTLFVPLKLSNCGPEVLEVELTCTVKDATLQVCRLLAEENKQINDAEDVVGTVTVPCGGAMYYMELQIETPAHSTQDATIFLTATAGQYIDTADSTISLLITDLWQHRFWAGCLEKGDTTTSILQLGESQHTAYKDVQLTVQVKYGL
jgi:ankyrin repeat protein